MQQVVCSIVRWREGTWLLVRIVYSPRRVVFILGVVRDVVTWSSSSALVGWLFQSEHYDSLAIFCHLLWVKTHELKHIFFCAVIPSAESVCFWKCVVICGIIFIIIYEGLVVLFVKKVALQLFQQQSCVLHLLMNVMGVLVLCVILWKNSWELLPDCGDWMRYFFDPFPYCCQ
jgi:hypothetical protein